MDGVDHHFRALSGDNRDFQSRIQRDALERQLRHGQNSQLTFGQVTDPVVDRWWLAVYGVESLIPLLPVSVSRKVDSRLLEEPKNLRNPSLRLFVLAGA